MAIVAGVDFGTLSVRVSIYDSVAGLRGRGSAEYPLLRSSDPEFATQRHADHMGSLALAMHDALRTSGVDGKTISAMALDTTGSSVIVVDKNLQPVSDYYLWCDHRASMEAAEITDAGRRYHHGAGFEGLRWCGGVYSSEWGWSKLLHWLRHNPDQRDQWESVLEHCDMVVATLCGFTEARNLPRSVCAMGHKWMWNPRWGGLPPEDFLVSVDPLLAGARAKISGRFQTSDQLAGTLCAEWAEKLGLRKGIPIPTGALDAHWDAIGANIRLGDVVNVVGTSTCIIGVAEQEQLVSGVCGVVPGSVFPNTVGVEAGLSAVGDIFQAIATRAGTNVGALTQATQNFAVGQTGLLRLTWDNGDRTVLVNPALGGVTFGWNLAHTAADEFFAAIEGTAMHTRIILERMEEHGTPIRRVINGGGIPKRNPKLNQVYADILGIPVLVAEEDIASLGAVIFAFLAAGAFQTVEQAQDALCPRFKTYTPDASAATRVEGLFALFRNAYFSLGMRQAPPAGLGDILPELRRIRSLALKGLKTDRRLNG